jgi:DNA-directed RNA polymerase subunit M/transcription elongation factor TFIIS
LSLEKFFCKKCNNIIHFKKDKKTGEIYRICSCTKENGEVIDQSQLPESVVYTVPSELHEERNFVVVGNNNKNNQKETIEEIRNFLNDLRGDNDFYK